MAETNFPILTLGEIREGNRLGRALYISKHRGAACSEEILPFDIDETGVRLC